MTNTLEKSIIREENAYLANSYRPWPVLSGEVKAKSQVASHITSIVKGKENERVGTWFACSLTAAFLLSYVVQASLSRE